MKNSRRQKIKRALGFILKEYDDSRIMTNAATITLWTFMSVFPILMLLMSALPLLPITLDDILRFVTAVFPEEMNSVLREVVTGVYRSSMNSTGITFNILILLWTSSSGVASLTRGVNEAYRTIGKRKWIVYRFFSILYTMFFILFILLMVFSFVAGRNIVNHIFEAVPALEQWKGALKFFTGWFAFGLAVVVLMIIYQVLPGNRYLILHHLPGALGAALGCVIFTFFFTLYIKSILYYSYVYGSLATIASMAIWIWVCMNIVLCGAAANRLWYEYYSKQRNKSHIRKIIRTLENLDPDETVWIDGEEDKIYPERRSLLEAERHPSGEAKAENAAGRPKPGRHGGSQNAAATGRRSKKKQRETAQAGKMTGRNGKGRDASD